MHCNQLTNRLSVAATWRIAQLGQNPKLIVTVSERMAQLVKQYFPHAACIAAPTCADLEAFNPPEKPNRKFLTYLGSGAPWQNLGQLSQIWSALYDIDKNLRFQVISKDGRAKVLKGNIPDEAIQFTAAMEPEEVPAHLWQAELGFLIRTPNIVNEVAFPTKFGEYVAAGVPVVATDVGWDFSQIIKKTRCGLLVNWSSEPQIIAREILAFRQRVKANHEIANACKHAADLMNKGVWMRRLSDALRKIT